MSRRRLIGAIATVAGVALLVWQVRSAGLDSIEQGLRQVGWWFLAILSLSCFRLFCRAGAWLALMPAADDVSKRSVLAAVIAGDAVGNVTLLSVLAGEPTKALYLSREVPTARSLPALAAENFFYSVSVAIVILSGTVAFLSLFTLARAQFTATVVVLGAVVAGLAAALWLIRRQPATVRAIVTRLPGLGRSRIGAKLQLLEEMTYEVISGSRGRLATVAGWDLAFHVASIAETWLLLWLITGSSSLLAAFIYDTTNRLINVVFRAVPLRMGVDEASAAFVSQALGFPDAVGIAMALVRKGRVLVWAAVGLGLLARKGISSPHADDHDRR